MFEWYMYSEYMYITYDFQPKLKSRRGGVRVEWVGSLVPLFLDISNLSENIGTVCRIM